MNTTVFSHGQLRLYLLTLLDERPMHGYELMQSIESRFGGTYVPSAGTIYPRLAKLDEEGLITKTSVGRKSVYAITDAGRAELHERKPEADRLEEEIDTSARAMADALRHDITASMGSLKNDLKADINQARHSAPEYASSHTSSFTPRGGDVGDVDHAAQASSDNGQEALRMLSQFTENLQDSLVAADENAALSDRQLNAVAGELEITASRINTLLHE